MSDQGWYAMKRGWLRHSFFKREPFTEREAWEWLISEAAHENTTRPIGGHEVFIRRSEYFCSLRFLCDSWKWKSISRVRGFLKRLSDAEMATSKKAQVGAQFWTQITICNYNTYQCSEHTIGHTFENKSNKDNSSLRSELSVVTVREKIAGDEGAPASVGPEGGTSAPNTEKATAKRGAYISEDWQPRDKEIQFALGKGVTEQEARYEAERFRDYWLSESGQRARKRDWNRTFRNRIDDIANRIIAKRRNGNSRTSNGQSAGRNGSIDGGIAGAVLRHHGITSDEYERSRGVDISGRRDDAELRQGGGVGCTVIDARADFENPRMARSAGCGDQAPQRGYGCE